MSERESPTGSAPGEQTSAAEALRTTIHALQQATQVLQGLADHMARADAAGGGPAAGAQPAMINAWEDDPFSERTPSPNPTVSATISEPAPGDPPATLSWRIQGPRPEPAGHQPGSVAFRYWNAEASLAHALEYWRTLLPRGTRWSTTADHLRVTLDAGRDLNAFYARIFGLRFFSETVDGTAVFSGESPDIIRHELGHAVLDAIRPQLFDAASIEVDAFHEAFGDMAAMVTALQRPSFRQKVLDETHGRLNVSSRLSRLAEQLSWGIRQSSPDAVDPDCLRNAANRFLYRSPISLPPRAPANQLSTGPHSFSRIFTGAFLDALAAMVNTIGPPDDNGLETASRDLGQLLVDGVLTAPVTPTYFSQVAAAMVQAGGVRHGARYRAALLGAFVERGLLDLVAARNLEMDQVPSLQPVAGGQPATGMAGGAPAAPEDGASDVLGYGPAPTDDYRADATSAPGLPLQSVTAEFLDQPVLCHVATEPERFAVTPALYGAAARLPSGADESARHFLATLIQLGRVDPGAAPKMVRGPSATAGRSRTHTLESQGQDLVLKRIQFLCGHPGPRAR